MSRRAVPVALAFALLVPLLAQAQVVAIRAGRLIDPETATILTNQLILVAQGRISAVAPDLAVPAGAEAIDLSEATVLPETRVACFNL